MGLPAPQNAPNSAPHQLEPMDFLVAMKMHRPHCSTHEVVRAETHQGVFLRDSERHVPELKSVSHVLELWPILERVADEHGHAKNLRELVSGTAGH